jgi:hypothetical protein
MTKHVKLTENKKLIHLSKHDKFIRFTNKKLDEPKYITAIALKEAELLYNRYYNVK